MEFDFRSRLNLSVADVGHTVTLTEAVRLVRILRADPSSQIAASIEGWTHSMSREALLLADLFDLNQATGGVKHPKAHPGRPWDTKRTTTHHGDPGGRTPEQTRALLARKPIPA